MKLIKICQVSNKNNLNLGYKAVGWDSEKEQAYSLHGGRGMPIDIGIGSIMENNSPNFHGFFLGSTKQYVTDYYSGLTDDKELLLTYEFDDQDIIGNFNHENCDGEIRVKKAKLIAVEELDSSRKD
jgi:hypothetical protein